MNSKLNELKRKAQEFWTKGCLGKAIFLIGGAILLALVATLVKMIWESTWCSSIRSQFSSWLSGLRYRA